MAELCECCMSKIPVGGIRQCRSSGSIMLGKGRRRNKGLVRKGCSGLIESFGSGLHWSETCYRDLVSRFPNNEISEKGFVVRWDSVLTFLCFLWFSLGCLLLSSSVLNLITLTIWKHSGWSQQAVFTQRFAVMACSECKADVWGLQCGFFVRKSVCIYMTGAGLASIWTLNPWCWLTRAIKVSVATEGGQKEVEGSIFQESLFWGNSCKPVVLVLGNLQDTRKGTETWNSSHNYQRPPFWNSSYLEAVVGSPVINKHKLLLNKKYKVHLWNTTLFKGKGMCSCLLPLPFTRCLPCCPFLPK